MKFRTRKNSRERQKGSVLVLTLWVVLFMSIFVLGTGYAVRQRVLVVQRLETREKLRHVAEAGVKMAIHVLNRKVKIPALVDTLNQDWSVNSNEFHNIRVGEGAFSVAKYAYGYGDTRYKDADKFVYGMIDEESKININEVRAPVVLSRLIQNATYLDSIEASSVAESILDWKDEDDHSYPSGAETQHYRWLPTPYKPKNRALDTLEELMFVKGMTPKVYYQLLPYVTLDGDRKVNINTASEIVLNALGMSESLVRKICSYRTGPDQIVGTVDDGIFTNMSSIIATLKNFAFLDEHEEAILNNFIETRKIDIASKNFTIQSVAGLKHRDRKLIIRCVVERHGRIKRWQEFYA